MEKPHYNQPITADNIETALQHYFKNIAKVYKFDSNNRSGLKQILQQITEYEEVKGMHDIEALLESDLLLVCEKAKRTPRHTQIEILDYILAANLPLWRKRRFEKYTVVPSQILRSIIIAKEKANVQVAPKTSRK